MALTNDQFDQLVLYIIKTAGDPSRLGAVKLNKILWFSDTEKYLRTHKSITDGRYSRAPNGPMQRMLEGAIRRLKKNGMLEETKGNWGKRLFKAVGRPNVAGISVADLKIIRKKTREICDNHTARSISERSHNIGWSVATDGEELPLYIAYASTNPKLSRAGEKRLLKSLGVDLQQQGSRVKIS